MRKRLSCGPILLVLGMALLACRPADSGQATPTPVAGSIPPAQPQGEMASLPDACRDQGLIAFGSRRDGNGEIYLFDTSSSSQRNLTEHPAMDWAFAWSPDGTRIAFESDRDFGKKDFSGVVPAGGQRLASLLRDTGFGATELAPTARTTAMPDKLADIFVVDVAGGGEAQNLSRHPAGDRSPSWSPDGQRIAFASHRDGNWEIYVVDVAGGEPQRLTDHQADDSDPAWSPAGDRIAFTSDRDGNREIYAVGVSGEDLANLTDHPGDDSHAVWSPAGDRIAFTSERDGNPEAYLMDADGSDPVNLSNDESIDGESAWAPDGSRIAFVSWRAGKPDIYLVDAGAEAGRGGDLLTPLTPDEAGDHQPSWSPDGRCLAYYSLQDDNWEIMVIESNGQSQTRLTGNRSNDNAPAWQPK